jgi:hypothetical protein
MKRLLSILSVIALVSFAAQAQAGTMYGGVKAGVNFANVGGDDAPDNTSTQTGFQGGLFIGTHVNDQFGFRVEGLYVMKGAKQDTSSVTISTKLSYIEFPILFVFDVSSSETMGFNLFAGPTLGFNIGAKVEDNDIKDNIKSFEFGAAIGAGIEKKMAGGKALGLDVRYSLGATSVAEDVTVGSTTVSPSVKNRGIGIMVGYSVPIGGSSAQ